MRSCFYRRVCLDLQCNFLFIPLRQGWFGAYVAWLPIDGQEPGLHQCPLASLGSTIGRFGAAMFIFSVIGLTSEGCHVTGVLN